MRKSETIMVPMKVDLFFCDSCTFTYKSNEPRNRYMFPIQVCTFCNKDVCNTCQTVYDEDDNPEDWFSPDAIACPECKPKADKVWAVALQIAGRHDAMTEVIGKVLDNWNTYQHWFNEYEFEEDK